ncbi:MAG: GNAT family N-acetyltransferase, partial [Thermoflexibacter sp.]|nr:GNAT family N-acetyltransferase [Thermoflexibacter sp.]
IYEGTPLELKRFYLLKAYQGKGIARDMMEACYGIAKDLGYKKFWLGVWEHNHRAQAFYKKCGFRKVSSHPFDMGGEIQTDDILLKEWEIVYDENKKSSENLYEVFVNEPKTQVQGKKKTQSTDMFNEAEVAKKKRSKDLFQIGKNILLNNLFGVDLSAEAVEITKLSLWLKTANNQNITLANLENNIKQGNSLIDDTNIDENAFVWEKEFPEIFVFSPSPLEAQCILRDGVRQKQGFDVVIGNPPYVAKTKDSIYKNYTWHTDLYLMFFEKCFNNLLKINGFLGFITPRFWLVNQNCKDFRQFMLTHVEVSKLVETSPFEDANTECTIAICQHKPSENDEILVFENIKEDYFYLNTISKKYALKNPYFEVLTHLNQEKIELLYKIEKNTLPLKNIIQSKRGMEIGKSELRNSIGVKTLIGQDTKRYLIDFEQTFVNANEQEYNRLKDFFDVTDLYLRRVANRLIAATASERYAFNKNIYGLKLINPEFEKYYLLALLNSKLLDFYYKNKFSTKKVDLFPEIQTYLFEVLPIKNIPLAQQQIFINKVQEILSLNPVIDSDRFQTIDNEIDKLVYELYELNEEEIKQVESVKI